MKCTPKCRDRVWDQNSSVFLTYWDASVTARGSGVLPATFFLGLRYVGLRLKKMRELACGFEYPSVNAAVARFKKRLKIDRELRQKIKKVAKN